MPKYGIEREVPNAGKLSPEELRGVSQKSCDVLREMGTEIQWIESYVSDNAIHCVYIASNEELIREHGSKGGFPVTNIYEVKSVIDPTTAE